MLVILELRSACERYALDLISSSVAGAMMERSCFILSGSKPLDCKDLDFFLHKEPRDIILRSPVVSAIDEPVVD